MTINTQDTTASGIYWTSLKKVESWLIANDFKAFDPFDGLLSPLRLFTFQSRFLQQVLQQAVRRNPFNLRPVIGIRPHTSTKGMGFLGGGYAYLYRLTGDEAYRESAKACFAWLVEHRTRGFPNFCWGNAFDYASRAFYLPRSTPTLVWSGLIGHHFIEAYRVFGEARYLEIADSVGQFIIRDIPRRRSQKGICFSYIPQEMVAVHNANLLGARLLAELWQETGRDTYLELASEAVRYSVAAQLDNGAWYYGEENKYHWIDNWHTAYNLDSILQFQLSTGSREFEQDMLRGIVFYRAHFFRSDGAARYYWDRDYKIDIQSCSQAIDTLLSFGVFLHNDDYLATAKHVADWTLRNMQDPSGYFYLWKNSLFTNRTPTFHWGAATMFHALSHLLMESHCYED